MGIARTHAPKALIIVEFVRGLSAGEVQAVMEGTLGD